MDTSTPIMSWREQRPSLRSAREALSVLASHPGTDASLAQAALLAIDAVSPEYEPPRTSCVAPSLDLAVSILRGALEDCDDLGEVSRIGRALLLLGCASETAP